MMKCIAISLIAISLVIYSVPAKPLTKCTLEQNITQKYNNQYTVRLNIDGKWYLVTYSSDGYIINIVEDDE